MKEQLLNKKMANIDEIVQGANSAQELIQSLDSLIEVYKVLMDDIDPRDLLLYEKLRNCLRSAGELRNAILEY